MMADDNSTASLPNVSVNPAPAAESNKLPAAHSYTSIGFCIYDASFRYVSVNDSLARMNGVPSDDHRGRTAREILGDFADAVESDLRRVFATGEPILNSEASGRLRSRPDLRRWVGHLVPFKDQSNTVTQVGAIVIEVSQKDIQTPPSSIDPQLRREKDRLQILADVLRILASNWDIPKVFPAISARIRRFLCQEYAGLSVLDPNSGLLVRHALDFPLGRGLAAGVPISPSNSPSGRSLEAGEPLIFSKRQLQEFEAETTQKLLAEGVQSLCCLPLLRPQGPIGVLSLGSTRPDAFHAEDLEALNHIARLLGIALENRRIAAELETLKQRLSEERKYLDGEIRSQGHFAEIIGHSDGLRQVLDQVAIVAGSDATVMILGETGTGKELIARAIHRMSQRRDASFIKLNCAAIPTGLLESELFGHERGAFTGAISPKVGRLELAEGGTLFLDEVGEIPLEIQPKLLRVLQDHEFERLGATRTIRVNVRLIAATNRDLARSIAQHEFRNDLFYRLNVFPITLPPLRDRREDVPLLVRYFVRKLSLSMGRHIETIPKATMTALQGWSWPGNIRELENLMERSVILSTGPALHVPLGDLMKGSTPPADEGDESLNAAEREHIIRVLRETRGVIAGPHGAARRLGLKRTTLQSKMQRLKITRQDYS